MSTLKYLFVCEQRAKTQQKKNIRSSVNWAKLRDKTETTFEVTPNIYIFSLLHLSLNKSMYGMPFMSILNK